MAIMTGAGLGSVSRCGLVVSGVLDLAQDQAAAVMMSGAMAGRCAL